MTNGVKHNMELKKVGYCLAIRNNTRVRSDLPGTSDWKKIKVSGTENSFFVSYYSLRHLRGQAIPESKAYSPGPPVLSAMQVQVPWI